MDLQRELADVNLEDIISSLTYLQKKDFVIEDVKLFDQFLCLKQFIASHHADDCFEQLLQLKWI